jgi:hypothetical protein
MTRATRLVAPAAEQTGATRSFLATSRDETVASRTYLVATRTEGAPAEPR